MEPRVAYSAEFENIFLNDERVARYRFDDALAAVDFGVNAGRYAQARIGYVYDWRKVRVDVGSPLLSESNPEDAGIIFSGNTTAATRPSRPRTA
jgi:hypothetical protein